MHWPRLFAYFMVSAALAIPEWVLLFGRRSDVPEQHYHPIASKPLGEKV